MALNLHKNIENNRKHVLAPSKCTVYISNLPFSFTNCDISKVFEKYGKIVRVTVMKDKLTRKSRGVAFILFNEAESARQCVKEVNGCEMFGRTLKSNIAKDNGRAPEFIRRREYPDKSRCYECRERGHLSYNCPKNILGEKEPPPKKKKKLKSINTNLEDEEDDNYEDSELLEDDSLSEAIRYQQELREGEEFIKNQMSSSDRTSSADKCKSYQRAKLKQSAYFSDEDELSD